MTRGNRLSWMEFRYGVINKKIRSVVWLKNVNLKIKS